MTKILAIDDQPDNLTTIKAIIKMAMPEFQVLFAKSGKEGISIAEKELPDIVLLDIVMPEMDGYKTCQILKQNKATRNIPVVMITAINTNAKSKAKAFELGADAFLTKPIEPVELIAQLKVIMRTKNAENKLKDEQNNLQIVLKERTDELNKSEKRYQSLIESSLQPIIVVRDGLVVFANRISMELSGYTSEEIINHSFLKLVHQEDQPAIKENYVRRISGAPYNEIIDFRIVNKNGNIYWFNYKASKIDWDNKASMLYILNDITKQKEVEELKKTSYELTEILLEIYNNSLSLNNQDLYEFALKKAISITRSKIGFFHEYNNENEIITLNIWNEEAKKNCYIPDSKHYSLDKAGNWADSIRKKELVIYNDYNSSPNKKGLPDSHVPIKKFMSMPVMLNDKVYFIFGVGNKDNDYTNDDAKNIRIIANELSKIVEKKNFEEQIIREKNIAQQNEYRFKTLHNASFGGIAIHDKGWILDCNHGLSEITGFAYEELIDNDGLKLIAPESRDMVMKNILKQYKKPYEAIGIRKNGERYPLRLQGTPIPYKGKEVRVVEFRDITDQKEKEKEIQEARLKAEQSDKLKSAFLANMSHEIRTPMNGILGYLELLRLPDITEEDRENYSAIIMKSSDRLLNTINDIIEFSKIEAGDIPINNEKVAIDDEIESIVNFFLPEANEKGIELFFVKPKTSAKILCDTDKSKFESIVTNLIKNAIKFTHQGEIEVGIKLLENNIEVSVRDTGRGIEMSKMELIFERFMQADITITRGHEGSGLGLSICKAYIEAMGGKIWVQSKYGVGSTFFFTLPFETSTSSLSQTLEIKSEIQTTYNKLKLKKGKRPKILVAEDDITSYMLVELILNQESIDTLHANNGVEAIELYKENPDISLILMDIKMPVMNGYNSAIEIRKINATVPIIALTAFAMPGDNKKAIKAGCNDYLPKPVSAVTLLEAIGKYIVTK